jgi:DNA polymerase III subunit delta'
VVSASGASRELTSASGPRALAEMPVGVLGPADALGEPGAVAVPGLLPWLDPACKGPPDIGTHHALLIHGPAGVGQFELAVALAQGLLCEAAAADRPRGWACGACAACRLVQAQTHPDLLVLLPEAQREGLRWLATAAEGEGGEGGSSTSKRKPSKELRVDDLREAVAFAQTTSARGRGKVVVLSPAERMNTIAANTLLKTLEEPPPAVRFLIASGAVDRLLPTVRSRCRPWPLATPLLEASVAWLLGQGVKSADVLLQAANGRPLEALALAQDGVDAQSWSRLPEHVWRGEASALQGWPVVRLIDALLCLGSDVQRLALGRPPQRFPAAALQAYTPWSLAERPDGGATLATLNTWLRELAGWARHAEHPFNAPLLVDALVSQAARALSGGRAAAPAGRRT